VSDIERAAILAAWSVWVGSIGANPVVTYVASTTVTSITGLDLSRPSPTLPRTASRRRGT